MNIDKINKFINNSDNKILNIKNKTDKEKIEILFNIENKEKNIIALNFNEKILDNLLEAKNNILYITSSGKLTSKIQNIQEMNPDILIINIKELSVKLENSINNIKSKIRIILFEDNVDFLI